MSSINKINKLNKSEFLLTFGNIFEKTEWIANKAFEKKPFKDVKYLFSKIIEIYEKCDKKKIFKIFKAHPDLAIAKKLTRDSEKEQNSASLNECSEKELKEFIKLNKKYKNKFKFPFIIAVKDKDKSEILNIFRKRIHNSIEDEYLEAKNQVKKIAITRLNKIFEIN